MGAQDVRHYRSISLSKKLNDRQTRAFTEMYLGGYGGDAIRERFGLTHTDQTELAKKLGIQRPEHVRPRGPRKGKEDSTG